MVPCEFTSSMLTITLRTHLLCQVLSVLCQVLFIYTGNGTTGVFHSYLRDVKDKTKKERKTNVVHRVRHTCSEAYVAQQEQNSLSKLI